MAYTECCNLQPRVRTHGWEEVSVDDGSFARVTGVRRNRNRNRDAVTRDRQGTEACIGPWGHSPSIWLRVGISVDS